MDNNIQYIGETLWPGQLGHFFIILSFSSILFAAYSYYIASKKQQGLVDRRWNWMGRIGFYLHSISVFGIIAILFYVMSQLMYEYVYVFEHCSDELPMRYIFSAFWEGQEGSFLLWMFWHAILGFVVIKTGGRWEAPVMMFLALVEAILASMLLGIHIEIGDWSHKLGSNPTLLLRDVYNAPIFQNADYLAVVKGDGLNPLLQNYWMTIHPPTLFLGFASCTIPFAYAAAGFFAREYDAWLKPVMRWSLFSTGVLGIGILMGGAWAYEALTFGGYWAWDPVENMSLVPWLIFVAGLHANLIARNTGRAIKSTYIYYTLGFVLILYSTYLTRSGVLGDTSVHSFTDMGLEWQLIFLVLFFAGLSTALYFSRSREIPVKTSEESIYSREFWMFIGALVLLFSGVIIAASTSLPVFNEIIRIFKPEFEGSVINDPIPHYNKFQIWIAILITLMSGTTIFMRYKTQKWNRNQKVAFLVRHGLQLGGAIVLSLLFSIWLNYWQWKYTLLGVCSFYAVTSNADYLVSRLRGNLKLAGAVVSHFGFGLMIVGTIASGLNERVISSNPFVMKGIVDDEDLGKVIKLIKNERIFSEGYWITYQEDTVVGKTRSFRIKFEKENENKEVVESFEVLPNVLFSNDLTKVAASNPDAKHYMAKDVFVSVQSLPVAQMDVELAKSAEDSLQYDKYELALGDTIFTKDKYAVIEYVSFEPKHKDYNPEESDVAMAVGIRFYSLDKSYNKLIEPALSLSKNLLYQFPDQLNDLAVKVKLDESNFDSFFTTEDKLEYTDFDIKQGESFEYAGMGFLLTGFDKEIDNYNYEAKPDDIAVQSVIQMRGDDYESILKPIYLIRNNKPSSLKDYDVNKGVHIRMTHIDPVNETFSFQLAMDDRSSQSIHLEIAENVPRTDFIGIEAIEFPGINLFWSGSIMMLMGFFISFFFRLKRKYA